MELRLLGPFEIIDDEGEMRELRGSKLNALLVVLALHAGEVVPTGRIIDDLWGEQEIRDPTNALQVVVSKLRKALQPAGNGDGSHLVVTAAAGYCLQLDPEAVDAVRFERLAADGRRLLVDGNANAAAAVLREALSLWRGPALMDFVNDDFAQGERTRLEELKATTVELRIEADLHLGHHETLIAELESLIAEHPLRERLRAQQMLALYRAGRQVDALRAYQTARAVLGEEVGVDPGPELQRLEAAILAQDPSLEPPARATRASQPGNLRAPLSSFVGRAGELNQIGELLGSHRLVTIVGPGGAGKTRLAVEAAGRAEATFPDGCWLIELAPIADAVHVEAAAATALGLDDPNHLDNYLADRHALIVLDNCEHLLDAAAALSTRLLRAGRAVRVLATSREGLGVAGERRWAIPPLNSSDANALFVNRATEGGLASAGNQSVLVDEICDRLDGLPLAVELAAARTRTLSLDDIAARIDDRFRLLNTGERTAEPRQQTLRRVVDWSYDLLFSDEQRVFRRLSVFAGGFGLPAAELVAAGDDVSSDDVLDIISHLVDKSLVTVSNREGETRYQLLQTLIDYGHLKLSEAGEYEATRDRHLAWIVGLAADARSALLGADQTEWVDVLANERDNIRAAIEWALARGRGSDAVAVVADFSYGWYISGAPNDARVLLDAALTDESNASLAHRATAHAWAAWMTQFGSGMTDYVIEHAERAVEFGRAADSRALSLTAVIAAMVRGYRGHTVEAIEVINEAAIRLDEEPDAWGRGWVDWVRCGLALKIGDPERASALIRSSIASFEAQGDRCGRAMASFRLSELAEARGDYDEAISAATLAYEATLVYGGRAFNTSTSATRLGNLAALENRFEDAAKWHADALTRAREGAYPGALAQALGGIAHSAYLQGRLDDAEEGHREALAVYESAESVEGVASTLVALGFIAAARGDHRLASDLHLRSLREASRGSDRRATALAIEGLAEARAVGGEGRAAAVLLGAAAEIRRDSGPPVLTTPKSGVDATLEHVRALVTAEELDTALSEGAAHAHEIVESMMTGSASGSLSWLYSRSGVDQVEEMDDEDVVRELREVRAT